MKTFITCFFLIVAGTDAGADDVKSQPVDPPPSAALFPSQHARDVKWFDSLAQATGEANRTKKPICLILAGQRPKGDC